MVATLLVPADDESLVGWIERTAHYTGTDPLTVARELGLVGKDGRLSYLDMEQCTVRRISALWSGPPESARALTLRGRYEVLDQWQLTYQHQPRHLAARAWIYLSGSRYCPQCLGENGVWKLQWKFPWITACPEHRLLLAAECPHCHGWPRSDRTGKGEHLLQQRAGTHPVFCKRPVAAHRPCGGNLSSAPFHSASPAALSTSAAILDVLHGNTTTLFGKQVAPVEAIQSWVEIALLALAATVRTATRQRLSPPQDIARCLLITSAIDAVYAADDANEAADVLDRLLAEGAVAVDKNWLRDVLPRQRAAPLQPVTAALLERNGRLTTRLRRLSLRQPTQRSSDLRRLRSTLKHAAECCEIDTPAGVGDRRWNYFLRLVVAYGLLGDWRKAENVVGVEVGQARTITRHVIRRMSPAEREAVFDFVATFLRSSFSP